MTGSEPESASPLPAENPIDERMQYAVFEDMTRRPLAVMFNVSCHNNMVSRVYSGDMFGRAGDELRAKLGDVATVMWLGYDAPGADLSAIRGAHAEAGAPLLDSFLDGLRVSHTGGPDRLTVIGHSYGSTVVGEAASAGDGLAVDDIIVAGSPGMRVDGVADLQIDPRHAERSPQAAFVHQRAIGTQDPVEGQAFRPRHMARPQARPRFRHLAPETRPGPCIDDLSLIQL